MSEWSLKKMRAMGMTEQDIKRARCKHDFGTMCMSTFLGCQRTCQKCGQMQIIPGGCTPRKPTDT